MPSDSPAILPDNLGDPLLGWLGKTVILDTQGPLLYIGLLEQVCPSFLTLAEADVHFGNDSRSTRDFYITQAREVGHSPNRGRVVVARPHVVSVSLLADVRI